MTEKNHRKTREKREKTETTLRVGSRVKSLRLKRELSQAQVAETSGISSKYLGEVERGEANISLELITRIATALNAPLSAILDNEHECLDKNRLHAEIIRLTPHLNEKDAQIVYRLIRMLTE
jgi:transcriptional regulator with XRE-family HTH domain